jgi:hypothetical protein
MREGSWKVTHQGIAVSSDGNIIDGQHRLIAVTIYGKPVKLLVTTIRATDDRGELTAVSQPIDIGKLRSISDITDEPVGYVTIVRTLVRDYTPAGSDRSQDPEIIAAAVNILRPSLSALTAKCGSTKKGLSLATVRGIMTIRHFVGIDVLDKYKDALNGRYERLPKSWVTWATRLETMSDSTTRIPKNQDFRSFVGAITWQVTDPAKNDDQMVLVKNTDRYRDLIAASVQDILIAALTKGKALRG